MSDTPSLLALPAPDPTSPPDEAKFAQAAAAPAAGTASPSTPDPTAAPFLVPRAWAFAILATVVLALVVSGLLWQKLGNIQEELARRSLEAGSQSIEARTLARQAQDSATELTVRLALQETRLSEVSLQRSQLDELIRSLSRSRDENLVVDIDSALRLAQQQAQLAGSAEPLVAALKSAEQRLQRAAQPRLNPLLRAIAKDTARIQATSLTDVPSLLVKLDEFSRLIDDLPLANSLAANVEAARPRVAAPLQERPSTGAQGVPAALLSESLQLKVWLEGFWQSLSGEAKKLLRISRIEQPEAALLSPEQSFFLRENLKFKVLNARLALLSRQTESARLDLQNASTWLGKYFDLTARKSQSAEQLLLQVQSQLKTSELPRLDESLAALATAAAAR